MSSLFRGIEGAEYLCTREEQLEYPPQLVSADLCSLAIPPEYA